MIRFFTISQRIIIKVVGWRSKNQRVTSNDHFQETRPIKLKAESGLKYDAGNVVVIDPVNDVEEVDEFMSLLGLNPDEVVHPVQMYSNVTSNSRCKSLPSSLTIHELVSNSIQFQRNHSSISSGNSVPIRLKEQNFESSR